MPIFNFFCMRNLSRRWHQSTLQNCYHGTNHPDHSGPAAQVYWLSLEPEPSKGKSLSVHMLLASGTNCLINAKLQSLNSFKSTTKCINLGLLISYCYDFAFILLNYCYCFFQLWNVFCFFTFIILHKCSFKPNVLFSYHCYYVMFSLTDSSLSISCF